MTKSLSDGREMLTAEEVHDMTGVPVSTLHDWAAKRERGIDAPGPHHIKLSKPSRPRVHGDRESMVSSPTAWKIAEFRTKISELVVVLSAACDSGWRR